MKPGLILVVVALLVVSLLGGAFFIVSETQQVVITQFGRPVGEPITAAGVHFKMPFIQTANFFEKRFLEWNGDPNEVPTKDKRFLLVDTYARWRITDPLKFFQRLQNERGALSRLDDIIDGETRNAIANHEVVEIVRSTNREVRVDPDLAAEEQMTTLDEVDTGRLDIMAVILAEASLSFLGLGDPTLPTWGQILEDGFRTGAVFLGYWWWVIAPGLLIVLTAVTFMLLALAFEPIVNPKLRRD